jgi:hypothetical protein
MPEIQGRPLPVTAAGMPQAIHKDQTWNAADFHIKNKSASPARGSWETLVNGNQWPSRGIKFRDDWMALIQAANKICITSSFLSSLPVDHLRILVLLQVALDDR